MSLCWLGSKIPLANLSIKSSQQRKKLILIEFLLFVWSSVRCLILPIYLHISLASLVLLHSINSTKHGRGWKKVENMPKVTQLLSRRTALEPKSLWNHSFHCIARLFVLKTWNGGLVVIAPAAGSQPLSQQVIPTSPVNMTQAHMDSNPSDYLNTSVIFIKIKQQLCTWNICKICQLHLRENVKPLQLNRSAHTAGCFPNKRSKK